VRSIPSNLPGRQVPVSDRIRRKEWQKDRVPRHLLHWFQYNEALGGSIWNV
jgi:hypothetical protein